MPKFVCLNCLSAKYDRRGNVCVYLGIVLLVGGILSFQIIPGYSMAIVMAGFSLAIYGGLQRLASEKSFKNWNHREDKQKAEPTPVDQLYVDELYSSLLQYYSNHWGPSLGHKLLRSEIFAYLSHGTSYQEAVRKIYKRQAEKLGM
jgi:hypothetical protein